MARARLLKPGFFSNEELCELPMSARLLFAGLWTIADKAGRLDDRPKRIKAEVFPYDKVNIPQLLDELEARGFIHRYSIADAHFIQIVTWEKHQHPHRNEPESIIPCPIGSETTIGGSASANVGSRPAEAKAVTKAEANTESVGVPRTPAPRSAVKRAWENKIGVISPGDLKEFEEYERLAPEQWFLDAIDETTERADRPSWAYCRSVLKRCVETQQPPRARTKRREPLVASSLAELMETRRKA